MEFAGYSRLEQLPAGAYALFAQAERKSVFFSRAWFEHLVAHATEDGQSILFACVVDGTDVLAMLPLVQAEPGRWHALAHLYSGSCTVLLDEAASPRVLNCLVEGLANRTLTSLRLQPVNGDDRDLARLRGALESEGLGCHPYFRSHNWIHQVSEGSFDAYMAARPSRVRNTIARKRRKLERDHDVDIRLFTDDDLARGMAEYHAVYEASWKAHEQHASFIDGMVATLARRGWVRLAVLYIDAQPAAAQLWFVAHRKASIFRLAYDEAWKCYSPGSILLHYLMQRVIDVDGVEEIDFLTGNDAYKQDWMSERRQQSGLYCARVARPTSRYGRFVGVIKAALSRLGREPGRRSSAS